VAVPLYEYQCQACGRRIEVLQRMGAGADGLSCPVCGSDRLDRSLSTFASTGAGGGSGVAGCAPSGAFT
jgi:putative FmdB family regulatory protein